MPHIQLSSTASPVLLILVALVAAAAAFLVYRYTLPPVSKAERIQLALLRTLALFLLCFLLFEPVARLVFVSTQPPALAVLVDNSRSMQLVDRGGNRADQLRDLLRHTLNSLVPQGGTTRIYAFGQACTPVPLTSVDSLQLNQDATDISAGLRVLAQERDQHNIRAALLITDGNYTAGPNPIYSVEQLGVPLFTAGIGDSAEQKDLLISSVISNEVTYSGVASPVDVTLRSSGFTQERVHVLLAEGGKEIMRAPLILEPGTRDYRVQLQYTAEEPGTKKYTVNVSTLPGELTTRNNRKTFYVRVLKSKLRILLIAGVPSPDVATLRQTLVEEKDFSVMSFTQKVRAGFYEGQIPPTAIDSSDCILLIGFPTRETPTATLDLVRAALLQQSMPVMFVSGKTIDEEKLRTIMPILPFTVVSTSSAEEFVSFSASESQKYSPLLALSGSRSTDAWNRLPPLFRTASVYRAKSEARVLGLARAQNVVLNDPLLLTRNVNRQKSVAFLGYGLWRWWLMTAGDPDAGNLLSALLVNSIRWLTTREDSKPVRVSPTKEFHTQGEPIEFLGQVYDASAQPVEDAELRIFTRHGDVDLEALLQSVGNGRYQGTLTGLGEGEFLFRATARRDGQLLGEDAGRFTVGEINLEYQDTRMNAPLLRQLAHRSGGRYVSPAELPAVLGILDTLPSFGPRDVTRVQELELWNWQYTLAIIVLLLALEWLLRKQRGML